MLSLLINNFINLFFTSATQSYFSFFFFFFPARALYNNDIIFFKNVFLNQ